MPVASASAYLTPPDYAARLGVTPEKIIAAIRRGELAAIDTAEPGSSRPRYRISPQAIDTFERFRAARPREERPARRRKSEQTATRYI